MADKSYKRNIIIAAGIIVLIILANIVGSLRQTASEQQLIESVFPPGQYSLHKENDNKWVIYDNNRDKPGFLYAGEGRGYNGMVGVLTHTDTTGNILGLELASHSETPSYIDRIINSGLLTQAGNINIREFAYDEPLDAVSGATITSNAIVIAVRHSYLDSEGLPREPFSGIVFGLNELFVILIMAAGASLAYIRPRKLQKTITWMLVVFTLVWLGFMNNQMLTLTRIAAILSGYLPDVTRELYLYLLLGGSIILILIFRRNVYCHSVCPFGSAQELLARVKPARSFKPSWYRKWKWVQWSAALLILLTAIAMNNPGLAQYAVFGVFFQFTGSTILFMILFVTIVLSLFIRRPWCRFACPIDGVFAYVRAFTGFSGASRQACKIKPDGTKSRKSCFI